MFKAKNLLDRINTKIQFESVSAHCDIPCKIYDPSTAQIAALTIIRVLDLIEEMRSKDEIGLDDQGQLVRLIAQKEEHGLLVKDSIRVIWGDYFKAPQIEKFPEIHELTHSIMLAGSKAKQNLSKDAALDLLDKVNRFAEIFWTSKGVATYRSICPYPPEQEVIYPDLKK